MPMLTTDDGVELYYEEAGAGTPIVFAHEFAGDHRSWEPQMRHFSRRYRCIAYNARGYTPSDVPEDVERYSQARARDDIRAALDALEIERAHIVGLSMGAFATLHFGMAYGPRALSLTVAGRRLWRAPGAVRALPERFEGERRIHPPRGHGEVRRDLRPRSDARAVPEQGPARFRRVRPPALRAFGRGLGEHHGGLPGPPSFALRPDRARSRASTCRR